MPEPPFSLLLRTHTRAAGGVEGAKSRLHDAEREGVARAAPCTRYIFLLPNFPRKGCRVSQSAYMPAMSWARHKARTPYMPGVTMPRLGYCDNLGYFSHLNHGDRSFRHGVRSADAAFALNRGTRVREQQNLCAIIIFIVMGGLQCDCAITLHKFPSQLPSECIIRWYILR